MWLILALTSHLTAAWYFRRSRPWLLWTAAALSLGTTLLWLGGTLSEAELRRPLLLASVPFLLGMGVLMKQALSRQGEAHRLWRVQSDQFTDTLARRFAFQLERVPAPERERLLAEFPARYRAPITEQLRCAEERGLPLDYPREDVELPALAARLHHEPHDPVLIAGLFALSETLLHAGMSCFPLP